MDFKPSKDEEVDKWTEVTLVYNSALKEIGTKLEILNDEFQHVHKYNPIEHIKSRLKSPESIVKKLKKRGLESSIDNMVEHVNDIAGVRIICSFRSDIYKIADMISAQNDLEIISVKDYLKNPKPSGYQSYHMLVKVPIFLSNKTVNVKVEIQIRTIAMDFWATLEHRIRYKFEGNAPQYIKDSLVQCANIVANLDDEMLLLNNEIMKVTKEMAEDN